MRKTLTAEQFVNELEIYGATELAKRIGITERNVYRRRRQIEKDSGVSIATPSTTKVSFPGRHYLDLKSGTVLIGSDFHIWPGEQSTCLRAFKKLCAEVQPNVVILNGDVMDFPRISRHPQNWEKAPDPQEEIEAAQDHLQDIVSRCKRSTIKIWTIGNHDIRFESSIANALPQFRRVKGVHLADHFPAWQKAMSCAINWEIEPARTMVKHRLKGGKNATYANIKEGGTHIVTGHLHCQNVRTVSDYRSFDLHGIDTGCIADRNHSAFSYTEDNPLDWRSGGALLTYRDGRLLYPELFTRWDDRAIQFRGKIMAV